MSVVTNIVLSVGVVDGTYPGRIDQVNRFFKENKGLVSMHDSSLPRGWCGGTKSLEAELLIGAFNQLDLEAFIDHLESIQWINPSAVQMFVKEQDDERFRLLNGRVDSFTGCSEAIMIDEANLEQRLAAVEKAIVNIQHQLAPVPPASNWLEKITGSITDEPAFLEALAYGKALRQADRPPDEPGKQP